MKCVPAIALMSFAMLGSQPLWAGDIDPQLERIQAEMTAMRGGGAAGTVSNEEGILRINGTPVIDPEGRVGLHAFDSASGDMTYLVRITPTEFLVRFRSAHQPQRVRTAGQLFLTPTRTIEFESAAGTRINGRHIVLTSEGVIIWRDDALFQYDFDSGMRSFPLPEQTYPTYFQRGQIAQTNVILVRKDDRWQSDNQQAQEAIGSLFKMLGGKAQNKDFELYDYVTGRRYPVDLQNITQQNERLYEGDFNFPSSHYFWKAQWFAAGKRRFAVHFARGVRDLLVTDLDTGVTKLAMNRGLGISSFKVSQSPNGVTALAGEWMFKETTIPDLVAWFDNDGTPVTGRKPEVSEAKP